MTAPSSPPYLEPIRYDGRETLLPTEYDAYEVRLRTPKGDAFVAVRIHAKDIARRSGGKFDAKTARAAVEAATEHLVGFFNAHLSRAYGIPELGARVVGPDGAEGRIIGIDRGKGIVVLDTAPSANEPWSNAVPWAECRYAP